MALIEQENVNSKYLTLSRLNGLVERLKEETEGSFKRTVTNKSTGESKEVIEKRYSNCSGTLEFLGTQVTPFKTENVCISLRDFDSSDRYCIQSKIDGGESNTLISQLLEINYGDRVSIEVKPSGKNFYVKVFINEAEVFDEFRSWDDSEKKFLYRGGFPEPMPPIKDPKIKMGSNEDKLFDKNKSEYWKEYFASTVKFLRPKLDETIKRVEERRKKMNSQPNRVASKPQETPTPSAPQTQTKQGSEDDIPMGDAHVDKYPSLDVVKKSDPNYNIGMKALLKFNPGLVLEKFSEDELGKLVFGSLVGLGAVDAADANAVDKEMNELLTEYEDPF